MAKQSTYQQILEEVKNQFPNETPKQQQRIASERNKILKNQEEEEKENMKKSSTDNSINPEIENTVTTENIQENVKLTFEQIFDQVKIEFPDKKFREQQKIASERNKILKKQFKKEQLQKEQLQKENAQEEEIKIQPRVPDQIVNPVKKAIIINGENSDPDKKEETKTVASAVKQLEISEIANKIQHGIEEQYQGNVNHIPSVMQRLNINLEDYCIYDDHKEGPNTLCFVMYKGARIPSNPEHFYKIYK
ncbi:MAG: hypothetical protein WCT85_01460 [Parachlamydiales bacterium]